MEPFTKGQRWTSETEPELGLGLVLRADERAVEVLFPAGGEVRRYALAGAPIRRVRFRVGDRIRDRDGDVLSVEHVLEEDGLIVYRGRGHEVPESALSDATSFSLPEDRIRAGVADDQDVFALRADALAHQHRIRRSPLRGLLGGRIDLLPHQLYIAHEVGSRHAPRVLLSDEVGLGKTIEAGLILHRLHLTGRAQRILLLVPEPLVSQWFVEMLRRFNLWFHIFDEERCVSIEEEQPGANPFLDDQFVLSAIGLPVGDAHRGEQVAAAGWDVVVIDEAHHLTWSPESADPAYQFVERLAARTEGLFLLTATPERLGEASHFARLRLLDPDRYVDLDSFLHESEGFRDTALIAEKLLRGEALGPEDRDRVRGIFGADADRISARMDLAARGDAAARAGMIEDLTDQHGPGRAVFRNTRAALRGFPERRAHLVAIEPAEEDAKLLERLALELAADARGAESAPSYRFRFDPRVSWLAALLREDRERKVVVICGFKEMVLALETALRRQCPAKIALFHEGLPLVQRDRNAAWFAEPDGAQALLCSEIGGEGRNFQFAHHLVMFDLPLDPELLEQRIGRLDRIGQSGTVHVHVPFVTGSAQEVLARWHHDGLNAIETCLRGGHAFGERFGDRVLDIALQWHVPTKDSSGDLEQILVETRAFRDDLDVRLEQGRDRLLELASCRRDVAEKIIDEIRAIDEDRQLDDFQLRVFDHFGVDVEEMSNRSYLVRPGHLLTDAFPSLPSSGTIVTADRATALAREDIGFLSWDHPMVTGALDLLLGSERGNSAIAVWDADGHPGVLLEALHVLEAPAPPHLHADRFLPPTPLRVVVTHEGHDVTAEHPAPLLARRLRDGRETNLLHAPLMTQELIPEMISASRRFAERDMESVRARALAELRSGLGREIQRLHALQSLHGHVRPEEIRTAEAYRRALEQAVIGARLRLDAVRCIWKGPVAEIRAWISRIQTVRDLRPSAL